MLCGTLRILWLHAGRIAGTQQLDSRYLFSRHLEVQRVVSAVNYPGQKKNTHDRVRCLLIVVEVVG